jgi:cobalamin-dependent methionine synthase I
MEILKHENLIYEVMRYLGYNNTQADDRIVNQISQLSVELTSNINEKNIYDIFNCQISNNTVTINNLKINSKNLTCCLKDCSHIALLAATLGTEADIILRRYTALDMEKALVAHAVCSAMIEQYCDIIADKIAGNSELSHLFSTLRFSPGYGDFDIMYQKDIIKILNCESSIGLTLTKGYMLLPSKSVTALIGFSNEKHDNINKCGQCTNVQCGFRRVH